MRIILSILFLSVCYPVTVDGYAYLENQTDHSGIQVLFTRTAPSSLLDSTTTATDGNYSIDLEDGIYELSFSKYDYYNNGLTSQAFYSNTTLANITLLQHLTLVNIPADVSTIQGAIDISLDGDTILVHPGTYIENINYNGKNIVVGSLYLTTLNTSYISTTIIDGNQNGSVVTLSNGEDTTAVFSGLTIQNGSASYGGGIYCSDYSSPTFKHVIIMNNTASYSGGGIYCNDYSSPKLVNITIMNNSASGAGYSSGGGGIYCLSHSNPNLINVSITNNLALGYSFMYSGKGGGACFVGSNPILNNVVISDNSSYVAGGIYFSSSNATLSNVTIKNNTAYDQIGGGIYLTDSNPSLNNTIVSNNTYHGIWVYSGNPIIQNSIVSYNTGTGISTSGNPSIQNTIVSNNTAIGISVSSGNPSAIYSDFYNNGGGNFDNADAWLGVNVTTNANGDSVDTYNNIQLDPLFVDAGNDDFNLQQGSPCVDAGDPTSAYDSDGSIVDMGAYPSSYGTRVPIVKNVPNEYSTIQSAIDASLTGDTVLVAAGTYTENIDYGGKNIVVISSHGAKQTTIIPYNVGITIVWFSNDETRTAKLIGFTLLNGGDLRGGAINIEGASPTIENCILIDSKSHAVNSWNSSPKFINCLFTGTDGRPIYFGSNYAYPEVINCTFVNNNEYGLFNSQNYIPDIKNCIIYNNTDGGAFGQFEINYSNIEGGWYYGVDNIDTDPLFCDPTIGDYSIAQNSPCVGNGENGANMGALGVGCTEPAVYGCTTSTACNYDSNANEDDGSCLFYDCAGECGGGAVEDECGICGGDGVINDCGDCISCSFSSCESVLPANVDEGWFKIYFNFDDEFYPTLQFWEEFTGNLGQWGQDWVAYDCLGHYDGLFVEGWLPPSNGTFGTYIHLALSGGQVINFQNNIIIELIIGPAPEMSELSDEGISVVCGCFEWIGIDECGVCGGNGVDADDDGVCDDVDGCVVEDGASQECGCNTGIAEGVCDCDGNVLDACGVCGGDGAEEGFDCDGNELSLFNGLIPEEFNIHSIYPNPFNPVTNITYGLPEHVNVQILVYDLSGKQIETLINQFQTPGYHSINWNADNHPSGVYFVKIVAGDYINTQKLMLVK